VTLRINTNIAAMNAHKNMLKTDSGLSASLEKLSSGLRINKAADDASGMSIADSLRSQGLSLGQAIKNANDGISMVQTADGALEESINIVNTIKTKAVQAAQDGQTTESRKAIQADINKLMQELDIIAKTTSFNNQKLLSGNFTNKKFQIGAYSGETVDISIGTGESTKIGHISTSDLTVATVGVAALSIYSNIQDANFDINTVDIQYDNTRENSMGALADAINKLSDTLGITANASVTTTTDANIAAGTTDDDFEINGVHIGQLTVQENDSDGALVASINQKTDQHGVFASVDELGKLTLTSMDNRSIDVRQDTATTAVLGATTNMSTLGKITLTQDGTAEIVVNDRAGGQAVSLTDNALGTVGIIDTTISSTLASGTVIESGSTIAANSILSVGAALVETSGTIATTGTSTIGSGSVLQSGTIINSGTTLTGEVTIDSGNTVAGTGTLGNGTVIHGGSSGFAGVTLNTADTVTISGAIGTLTEDSTLTAGSTLIAASQVNAGSYMLTSDYNDSEYAVSGNYTTSGAYTIMTANTDTSGTVVYTDGGIVLLAGSDIADNSIFIDNSEVYGSFNIEIGTTVTLNSDTVIGSNDTTTLVCGSVLATNTNIAGDNIDVLHQSLTLSGGNMTLTAGSSILSGSTFGTATQLSDAFINDDDITVSGGSMTLAIDSHLASGTVFAEGSSLGGSVTTAGVEHVDATTDMLLTVGSTLATGSVIAAGTRLTNDIVANDGVTYRANSTLDAAITTSGATTLAYAMTLEGGSTIAAGSVLAANAAGSDANTVSGMTAAGSYRLSDVDVTTQDKAQIAIAVASAALKALDKVRADLGSVQNQLTSTIANITVTRVNIFAAESAIRDVDFAEEAANFTKMQILAQAGAFAMAQANASSQNVLSLLQ